MYGHAARNDRGSAVAKKRPDRADAQRRAAIEQRMRPRAERVQVLGDRCVGMIASRDREVTRCLTQQHAEALDVARGLRAQPAALRRLDGGFELRPARLPLGDEGVEAHWMPLVELQVHALDEQLRWPAPFRRIRRAGPAARTVASRCRRRGSRAACGLKPGRDRKTRNASRSNAPSRSMPSMRRSCVGSSQDDRRRGGGGGERDQRAVADHDRPGCEVAEAARLRLEEHHDETDQQHREVDDANHVAHRDRTRGRPRSRRP